jgi:phosphatidylinositol 3-kinase
MDRLLKSHLLDLRLTPYRVIATSPNDGFVEFIANSHTIQHILEAHNKDIKRFFMHHNPRQKDQADALNTFVKSCAGTSCVHHSTPPLRAICLPHLTAFSVVPPLSRSAGYCVMTYILGIGDRHLENILLTTDGHMFHIDFGFIFGKDPKPLPPAMKFSKEMVEAMGGASSVNYRDFRHYCCLAFKVLRKHAHVILNLLSLMADANIPNMMDEPETHIRKVQDNFQLGLSDEEADHYILGKIDESLRALFTVMNDKLHSLVSYWK